MPMTILFIGSVVALWVHWITRPEDILISEPKAKDRSASRRALCIFVAFTFLLCAMEIYLYIKGDVDKNNLSFRGDLWPIIFITFYGSIGYIRSKTSWGGNISAETYSLFLRIFGFITAIICFIYINHNSFVVR